MRCIKVHITIGHFRPGTYISMKLQTSMYANHRTAARGYRMLNLRTVLIAVLRREHVCCLPGDCARWAHAAHGKSNYKGSLSSMEVIRYTKLCDVMNSCRYKHDFGTRKWGIHSLVMAFL